MIEEMDVEYFITFRPEVEAFARSCFQTYWNMNGTVPHSEWVRNQIHKQKSMECPSKQRIFELCKQLEMEIS